MLQLRHAVVSLEGEVEIRVGLGLYLKVGSGSGTGRVAKVLEKMG